MLALHRIREPLCDLCPICTALPRDFLKEYIVTLSLRPQELKCLAPDSQNALLCLRELSL